MEELSEIKIFARHLANISADVIKPYFRSNINVEFKKDKSPVTIADKKAEEIMRELIVKEFPDHGIIGEEFGTYKKEAEYKWILDPIDGTKSFICGALSFGTLIALLKDGEPILGVINHPILDEFLVGDNNITLINDKQSYAKKCDQLSDAILLTTDHLNFEKYRNLKHFENLIKKVKLYRQWGDCYGYYLLATGYVDVMIDPIMSVWDTMALIPIIKGAGGIITDYYGNNPSKGDSIIASATGIHKQVVEILNDH